MSMIEQFIEWNPKNDTLVTLNQITDIIREFRVLGYRLTVRQLYYQLVGKDLIPNNQKSYKRIVEICKKGRLAGYLDWGAIEDRGRRLKKKPRWKDPKDLLRSAAKQFHRDLWGGQEYYVEVWAEKDAVSSVIEPVCERWDVHFLANRGYNSASAMYKSKDRFFEMSEFENRKPVIIYVGDHDPSGMDMSRDIGDRLDLFLENVILEMTGYESHYFPIDRAALNMDQVTEHSLPENPAKTTDSRSTGYIAEFGPASWELDALSPQVLDEIVEAAILKYLDEDLFKEKQEALEVERKGLYEFIKTYRMEDK